MQLSITGDSRNSKKKKRKLEHSKIDTYLAKPLSKMEKLKFNNHLLLMMIANGWVFQWVNKKQSREAYAHLNPNLHLPDCRTLAGKTLNMVLDNIASYVINQAKTSEYEVTVAFDRWTNVVNQCLIGSVLVTNNGEPLIWD
ncbi:32884_t:CDS:1, partial [Gigaspora margarita]